MGRKQQTADLIQLVWDYHRSRWERGRTLFAPTPLDSRGNVDFNLAYLIEQGEVEIDPAERFGVAVSHSFERTLASLDGRILHSKFIERAPCINSKAPTIFYSLAGPFDFAVTIIGQILQHAYGGFPTEEGIIGYDATVALAKLSLPASQMTSSELYHHENRTMLKAGSPSGLDEQKLERKEKGFCPSLVPASQECLDYIASIGRTEVVTPMLQDLYDSAEMIFWGGMNTLAKRFDEDTLRKHLAEHAYYELTRYAGPLTQREPQRKAG